MIILQNLSCNIRIMRTFQFYFRNVLFVLRFKVLISFTSIKYTTITFKFKHEYSRIIKSSKFILNRYSYTYFPFISLPILVLVLNLNNLILKLINIVIV